MWNHNLEINKINKRLGSEYMQAERIMNGSCIGLVSPSHVAKTAIYERIAMALRRLGFTVKPGKHLFKNAYGYAASTKDRVEDFNRMVSDPEVEMIMFGGGDAAVDLLPYIDYKNIARHPKIFASFSDGTSILNAIYAQTGLITYYGVDVREFCYFRQYDREQFYANFIKDYEGPFFIGEEPWKVLCGGFCEGVIIGGYAPLFAMLLSNKHFKYDKRKKYLLILEDNEKFSKPEEIATYLGYIEQSEFIENVSGLIFGSYSDNVPQMLLDCLQRFGTRNKIPVVYTDDFGHGKRHGILPIGVHAKLDADRAGLKFCDLV